MRTGGHPKWLSAEGVVDLQPVVLAERDIQEEWLQRYLDRHPDLVPIEEVGRSWGPLVSLGREIGTTAGPIDNLFVSPNGDLTVVETKLWRNPEARRTVVGQILDYAAALSSLSYEQLDGAVAGRQPGLGVWQRVQASKFPTTEPDEATFVDAVRRSLRTGSFLLLIIGDGIREDLEGIASLLRQHPGLQFHLALIEMRLFRRPDALDGDFLMVPTVIGQSKEITRAVVEVRRDDVGAVHVEITPNEDSDDGSTSGRRMVSMDEFVVRASKLIGEPGAEAVRALADWWQSDRGQSIELKQDSVTLRGRFDASSNRTLSVMNISIGGRAMASVRPMRARALVSPEEASVRFAEAGFSGSADWPSRTVEFAHVEERENLQEILRWLADCIDEARTGQVR